MRAPRKPRLDYGTANRDKPAPRPPLWRRHWVLLCGSVVFLLLAIGAVFFFLGESDISFSGLQWGGNGNNGGSGGSSNNGGGSVIVHCETDADCENCCPDYAPVHLGACLLPPNTSSASCVKGCCVPPEPIPKPAGAPCHDSKWCTINDACDGNGQCAGAPRSCVDADFCTLETCSEELRACAGVDVDDESLCENACDTSEDCRTDFFCAQGRCARFSANNVTLFFLGYDIEACDSEYGYAMVQQYVVAEQGYSLNMPAADGGGMRYRVLRSATDVVLPPPEEGSVGLLSAHGAQTRIVPPTSSTPGYSEMTFSVRTECLDLFDVPMCLTAWKDRVYDFELDVSDCAVSPEDPLGVHQGTIVGECMSAQIRRTFSMSLDLIHCPMFAERKIVEKSAADVRIEYYDEPGVPLTSAIAGSRLRVVVEANQQEGFLDYYDPFLTDVSYCGVKENHRLRHCVTNADEACPFRGCTGWSQYDTPVTFVRTFMENSEALAATFMNLVEYCRGNPRFYAAEGCVPGHCDWRLDALAGDESHANESNASNYTDMGRADGFTFYVDAPAGSEIVVDLKYRYEDCQTLKSDRRRLSSSSLKRRIGTLKVLPAP